MDEVNCLGEWILLAAGHLLIASPVVCLTRLQADTATSGASPAHSSGRLASPLCQAGSASPASTPGAAAGWGGQEEQGQDGSSGGGSSCGSGDEGEEGEGVCTVVHNGMVITHVPASQVSKVRPAAWVAVAGWVPCVCLCGLPPLLVQVKQGAATGRHKQRALLLLAG